ncbi:hypothetical protein [Chitinophaga sp. RAB17]|uniref:hypothetical protein n=1 Tax=Chitinophaga sp. RAB17 TaxID=3233049 RepID=UPI003F911725
MMQLQKIITIVLVTGCMSCQSFRDSIHDTFNGTNTDSTRQHAGTPAANRMVEESSSTTVTSSTVHTSSTVTSSTEHSSSDGFLANAARLTAAEQALRHLPAFAGKDIYLYEGIHFYDDGRIGTKVQHPQNPAYIDEYEFVNGHWKAPEPVQLSVHDDIQKRLIKLDDISFGSVATVYRNYQLKADSVTGTKSLTHIYAIFDNKGFSWYPQSLDGSRERYFISFTKDGNLQRFYRE